MFQNYNTLLRLTLIYFWFCLSEVNRITNECERLFFGCNFPILQVNLKKIKFTNFTGVLQHHFTSSLINSPSLHSGSSHGVSKMGSKWSEAVWVSFRRATADTTPADGWVLQNVTPWLSKPLAGAQMLLVEFVLTPLLLFTNVTESSVVKPRIAEAELLENCCQPKLSDGWLTLAKARRTKASTSTIASSSQWSSLGFRQLWSTRLKEAES